MEAFKKYLSMCRWLLAAACAFFTGVAKVVIVPNWLPEWSAGLFPWIKSNQFWLIPGPLILIVIVDFLVRQIAKRQRHQRLRVLLEKLLATLRERFIRSQLRNDPASHHRLTIFKANKKQSRLEIVARSAEATSGSKTTWRIHPDDESRCEGLAGVGWYQDIIMMVPGVGRDDLPDISQEPTAEQVAEYARRTFVTESQVRECRWSSRSFATLTIRVDGRRWGVLVLDSISPQGTKKRIVTQMSFTVDMLGAIIKEWSDQ